MNSNYLENIYQKHNHKTVDRMFQTRSFVRALNQDSHNEWDDVIKKIKAPPAASVFIVPSKIDESNKNNLQNIDALYSFISVEGPAVLKSQDSPLNPFDINNTLANEYLSVITQKLAGIMTKSSGQTRSFSKATTPGKLHDPFLKTMFDSFNFSASDIKELDVALSHVSDQINDLNINWKDQNEHVIFVVNVAEMKIPIPFCRLFGKGLLPFWSII
jgi:hypothetical protein